MNQMSRREVIAGAAATIAVAAIPASAAATTKGGFTADRIIAEYRQMGFDVSAHRQGIDGAINRVIEWEIAFDVIVTQMHAMKPFQNFCMLVMATGAAPIWNQENRFLSVGFRV